MAEDLPDVAEMKRIERFCARFSQLNPPFRWMCINCWRPYKDRQRPPPDLTCDWCRAFIAQGLNHAPTTREKMYISGLRHELSNHPAEFFYDNDLPEQYFVNIGALFPWNFDL